MCVSVSVCVCVCVCVQYKFEFCIFISCVFMCVCVWGWGVLKENICVFARVFLWLNSSQHINSNSGRVNNKRSTASTGDAVRTECESLQTFLTCFE